MKTVFLVAFRQHVSSHTQFIPHERGIQDSKPLPPKKDPIDTILSRYYL